VKTSPRGIVQRWDSVVRSHSKHWEDVLAGAGASVCAAKKANPSHKAGAQSYKGLPYVYGGSRRGSEMSVVASVGNRPGQTWAMPTWAGPTLAVIEESLTAS